MIQDHANAVLGLLRAVPNLTVYPQAEPDDTGKIVPDGALPPYVAVHIRHAFGLDPSLVMASTRMVLTINCHCVGGNDIAARAVAQMVSGALLDVRPLIASRRSYPIRHEPTGQPPRPDVSTGRPVVDLVDEYRLETLPG